MALTPGELVNSSGVHTAERHVDYGTDDPNEGHSALSNVQQTVSIERPPPAAEQTYGRNRRMWAFASPVEAQGSFANTGDSPTEFHLHSDPGSNFALEKQNGGME